MKKPKTKAGINSPSPSKHTPAPSKAWTDKVIDALVKVKAGPAWISLIYLCESIKEAARAQQGPLTLLAGAVILHIIQKLNGQP